MPSRPVSPESLGPELVAHINAVIARAESSEGSPELGAIADDLCRHYRALAICFLAHDADVDGFFHWLIHSPITRRHYLTSVAAKGLGEPKYACASFVDPVLDAMAARQWKLASTIVSMASPKWIEGEEYEDDFCYGEFLRRIVTTPGAVFADVFDRWRDVLDGGRDPRWNMAQAFGARKPSEFEETLRSLLEGNERKAREMADPNTGSVLASDYPFFPNRWISIEGLALLAAAEREGISVDYEIEACPRIARTATYAPFRPRAYPQRGLE